MLILLQVVSGLTVKIADLGNACWVRFVNQTILNPKENSKAPRKTNLYLLFRSTITSQRTSRPGNTEALKFF